MTFERKFFFGFLVEGLYQKFLLSVNISLLNVYIGKGGNYLQEEEFQSQRYLGCYLLSPAEIPQLELMELHIFSLLKRLIPNYPYDNSTLVLFPVVEFSNEKV